MRTALLAVLLLAACSVSPRYVAQPAVVAAKIPTSLTTCPSEPPPLPPPPKPRTVESIAKWASQEDAALGDARTALRICHQHLWSIRRRLHHSYTEDLK